MLNNELLERIMNIDWVKCIGVKESNHFNARFITLESLDGAVDSIMNWEWDNIRIDMNNDISSIRFKFHYKHVENWNDVVFEIKSFLEPMIDENIATVLNSMDVSSKVKSSILWDLMGVLLEDTYRKYNHGVTFYSELLEIYESGHLLCGWYGNYPDGKFVIY